MFPLKSPLERATRPAFAAALLLAASVLALAAAFVAQYGFGLEPCPLCLYQRVPYVAGGILAAAALVMPAARGWLLALAGMGFAVNAGIALYHVGVENHWWASAVCGGAPTALGSIEDLRQALTRPPPKPCDAVDWTLFGISMAGYNIAVSLGLAALAAAAWARTRTRTPP
ncbi:MAG: disulfide bond formation protein B [Alphaproteobacteria bacterium]|nr:disulfide bond formation protein B [Alphaproteobacteria bacterium]